MVEVEQGGSLRRSNPHLAHWSSAGSEISHRPRVLHTFH